MFGKRKVTGINTGEITNGPVISTANEKFSTAPPVSRPPHTSAESLFDRTNETPPFVSTLGILGLVWLFMAMALLSDAGCSLLSMVALMASGFLLGVLWYVGVLFCWGEIHSWKAKAWMAVVPLAGMLGFVLAETDADLALRVWLCESSLKHYAVVTRPHDSAASEWVGLFQIKQLDKSKGAFALYTSKDGMMDRAGIAYVPTGSQPPPAVRIKRHLYGNWYSFWWKF